MHYGCQSNLGLEMKASLELLILELGVTSQPLQESYKKYGGWATHSWLKSLWEKCDLLDFRVEFREGIIKLPRERDRWIMLEFIRLGYSLKDLERLNRVRQYQQVLFLSCVLGASMVNAHLYPTTASSERLSIVGAGASSTRTSGRDPG
jgi:hypothetical protein